MDNNSSDDQIIRPTNTPEASSPPPPVNDPMVQPAPQPSSEPITPQQAPSDLQVPLAGPPKPKGRWLKRLIALVVIAALAFVGWLLYQELNKKQDQSSTPTTQNKNIELMKVGIVSPDYGELYPDMSPQSYNYLINGQIFEGLVRYEEKSKIVPLLATDWTNPNDKTWIFNLQQGVKFHDGNMMTAKDVKYSIDKIINAKTDYTELFASTIDAVEVVNDYQVKITTVSPDPTLLNRLAFLYVIDSNAPKGSEPSQAGTGPYMIKPGTKPTAKDVQMVAFEDYHGGSPTTKALQFGARETSAELIKAFKAGEFNIVGEIPDKEASEVSGATRFITSEPEVAFIGLNVEKPGPLANKKVREAIRYGVDAELLGEAKGDEVTALSQLIPESIPGHNPAINPYQRDVVKARQLLKEAGYPDGVTIQFAFASEDSLGKELKRQLAEAGINIKVTNYSDFNAFIDFFLSGKAESFYVVYTSDILDGLDIYETALTGTGNYDNEELNKLLAKAADTVDPATRLKLLQDAAVIIDKDVAIVPLSTQDNLWLMDKDYDITQDQPSSFLSVYFHKTKLK